MPESSEQKARSRARIVEAASRLFRGRGYRDTSVDDLMADAGLTRGGFYAHFESKAALLGAALEAAFAESRRNLFEGRLAALRGDAWRRAASERYLSREHQRRPEEGCAVPALGAEVARAEPEVRDAFEAEVRAILDAMSERLDGDRARAMRLLSTWVGATLLSRAVHSPRLADAIRRAAREAC
ncbi:MAG: TetR/AcrR family transcriptional regulator [Sandaracinaceae bacterium]|nr:TetR/AcrR family transcriptional regulator [Sandaracinaceae bacterium]